MSAGAGTGEGALPSAELARLRSWRVLVAQFFARARADLSFAIVDAGIVAIAYTAALVLRFLDLRNISPDWWRGFLIALPVIVALHLLTNLLFGAYGHVWEYASVEEAMRLVFAAATTAVLLVGGVFALQRLAISDGNLVPLIVVALGSGLALGGMGAVRFRSRLFSFHRSGRHHLTTALVVGTGRAAVDLARSARGNGDLPSVVAFVSVEAGASPRRLAGLPVAGTIDDVPRLVAQLGVDQVVIADLVPGERIRTLVDDCLGIDVGLRIAPSIDDVLGDNGSLRDVRDLELVDLLSRPTVVTDLAAVADLLSDKRILVTGAGGSIGSEIVRQVCRFRPEAVLALDNDETHLYEAMLDLELDCIEPTSILGDVRDPGFIARVFADHRPHVVFHAAAHKHVPILEQYPDEAAKTNVVGTANVLDASRIGGVEHFVLISTDKAVDPSSMMGASKRVAEMLTLSAGATRAEGIYSAVRFGNVLGSRGSVVPTFMHQIQHGGPVTVSDPDMLRYFMTIGEAVQLVLQAAALSEGGEVFVLDMGEPVRIGDLARRMIRLAGLVPGRDIEVRVTGTRPGEKMAEILSPYPLLPSPHPKVKVAVAPLPPPITLLDGVSRLAALAESGDRRAVGEMLHTLASHPGGDETIILDEWHVEPRVLGSD